MTETPEGISMDAKSNRFGDVKLVALVLIVGSTIDINPLFDDVLWSGAAWHQVFQHGIVLSNILNLFGFAGAVALTLLTAVAVLALIWVFYSAGRGIGSRLLPAQR